MIPTVLAVKSASLQQWDNQRACHIHWEPNYHERACARTTCKIRESSHDGRRAFVRGLLLGCWVSLLGTLLCENLLGSRNFCAQKCAMPPLRREKIAELLKFSISFSHRKALVEQVVHGWDLSIVYHVCQKCKTAYNGAVPDFTNAAQMPTAPAVYIKPSSALPSRLFSLIYFLSQNYNKT